MDRIEFRIAFGKRIEKFRKGEVDVRISTIQELAKGLEVHPQELFDFEVG